MIGRTRAGALLLAVLLVALVVSFLGARGAYADPLPSCVVSWEKTDELVMSGEYVNGVEWGWNKAHFAMTCTDLPADTYEVQAYSDIDHPDTMETPQAGDSWPPEVRIMVDCWSNGPPDVVQNGVTYEGTSRGDTVTMPDNVQCRWGAWTPDVDYVEGSMDVYLGGSYEHVDGPNTWPSQQSGVTSAAFGDPPTTTTTTEAPTTTTSAPPSTTTTTTAPAVCGESSHTDENGDTTYERCPVQLAGFTDSTWAALVAFVGVTLGAVSGYVLVRVTRR